MSHRYPLPPEILDFIVDHLHDESNTLKSCSVVSKSWVPRSRRHLFARVNFDTLGSFAASWMKAFPKPSDSPAHYTRTLTVTGTQFITTAGADARRWIHAFRNVVHLHVDTHCWHCDGQITLVPLYGLSSAVKSLRLEFTTAPPSEVFGLLCSFPLLEDLALQASISGVVTGTWSPPLTSPRLTGSLELSSTMGELGPAARRLLDLPNGSNFTKIVLVCHNRADFKSAVDLVSGCSATLEVLDVTENLEGVFPPTPCPIHTLHLCIDPPTTLLDLSTATRLKDLVFQCCQPNAKWIINALQTIKSKDLRQITLRPDARAFWNTMGETVYREWGDLDRLLVEFRTSRPVRPKLVYEMVLCEEEDMRGYALSLLPELTGGGHIDLLEYKLPLELE